VVTGCTGPGPPAWHQPCPVLATDAANYVALL